MGVTNAQKPTELNSTGVSAGTYGSSTAIPQITVGSDGRITSATTKTVSTSLSTTGVTAGTYGSATAIPQITVDAYGRVTKVSTITIEAERDYYPITLSFSNGYDPVSHSCTLRSSYRMAPMTSQTLTQDQTLISSTSEVNKPIYAGWNISAYSYGSTITDSSLGFGESLFSNQISTLDSAGCITKLAKRFGITTDYPGEITVTVQAYLAGSTSKSGTYYRHIFGDAEILSLKITFNGDTYSTHTYSTSGAFGVGGTSYIALFPYSVSVAIPSSSS